MAMAREATSNGHDAYLRPQEVARISWEWVTSDGNGNADRAAIVLRPVEESRASKTGEYDECVTIDREDLVRALLRPRAERLSQSHLSGVPEVPWQALRRAISLHGVETALATQVPYVLRHTSPETVADGGQGSWKSAGSVRRYAKGGRFAHQMSACSEPPQRFATLCVPVLPDLRPPLRPPALPRS